MAGTMPNFISRLIRPFTSSTRISLNPDGTSVAQDKVDVDPQTTCTVAAGCFWGVEHMFRKNFEGKGLLDAKVGYIGGEPKKNAVNWKPDYSAVCSKTYGYAEALQVTFDPSVVTYSTLLQFFYRMHDPTTKNKQGNDQGIQYRSAIFYHSPEQEQVAKSVTEKAQNQWWKAKITTEIVAAGDFTPAEAYHQLYLDTNPGGYQCAAHKIYPYGDLTD